MCGFLTLAIGCYCETVSSWSTTAWARFYGNKVTTQAFIRLYFSFLIVHFWAPWAPQCEQMNEVMNELANDSELSNVTFAKVSAITILLV